MASQNLSVVQRAPQFRNDHQEAPVPGLGQESDRFRVLPQWMLKWEGVMEFPKRLVGRPRSEVVSVLHEELWSQAGSLELVQRKHQQPGSASSCPEARGITFITESRLQSPQQAFDRVETKETPSWMLVTCWLLVSPSPRNESRFYCIQFPSRKSMSTLMLPYKWQALTHTAFFPVLGGCLSSSQ